MGWKKANKEYHHAVTCWGAAYDEENNIVCVYIAESNLAEAVLYPFGITYDKDICDDPDGNNLRMYNYVLSKLEDIRIEEMVTLDRGVEQFKHWLSTH